MRDIKNFDELKTCPLEEVGGKGYSLINMFHAGFKVPNGFVIPANLVLNDNTINQIMDAFDQLNVQYVAVRSSATVEDGNNNSWAGQFSSYLNVSRDELISNIKNVHESVNNYQANVYSEKIKSENIKMAVIVQEMVNATESGIAFSMNPVNQDNSVVVIEAGLGLGEPIVSGMITPDYYEVTKVDKNIKKNINNQTKALFQNGYNELDNEKSSNQKLSDDKITKIRETVIELENHFNLPIDVEWAYDNDELFVVQARPITKTSTLPIYEVMQKIINNGDYFSEGTGIYFSWFVEDALIKATGKEMQEKVFDFYIPFDKFVIVNGDEYIASDSLLATKDTFKENYKKMGIGYIKNHFENMLNLCDNTEEYRKKLSKMNFKNLNNKELKLEFERFYEYFLEIFTSGTMEPSAMLEEELENRLFSVVPKDELEQCLSIIKTKCELRNLDYVDEPLNLLYLAQEMKQHYGEDIPSQLSEYFNEKIRNHISEYGYLQDLPEFYHDTIPTVQYYVDRIKHFINTNIDEKINNILQSRKKVEEDYKKVINKYQISGDLLELCDMVRLCIMMRTYKVSFTDKLYYTAKYFGLFDEIANRLNISTVNLQAMSSEEILNSLDGKEINIDFDSRINGYYILWSSHNVQYGFGKDAEKLQKMMSDKFITAEELDNSNDKIIKGSIANMGFVKGRVKVVLSPDDMEEFNEGDILVTTMTRPELIPAMEKAIGFITNEGGMTCHAAIVSREFNVPCIVGTTVATKLLKDGDLIELNAIEGIIKII